MAMNGEDIKWLEKLFDQHKVEQQIYLDTKFQNLENKIDEVKIISVAATEGIIESEKHCIACKANICKNIEDTKRDLKKAINKKLVAGGVVTCIVTITLLAAFGTDIAKSILSLFTGIIF